MAAIQGYTVWNNRGSSWEFSNRHDAWQAYGLICDFEAYINELVDAKIVKIEYGQAIKTETKHYPFPEPWDEGHCFVCDRVKELECTNATAANQ